VKDKYGQEDSQRRTSMTHTWNLVSLLST